MKHLHNYQTIADTGEAVIEYCKDFGCKKKLITKKDKLGRYDQAAYAKEHERDTIQRSDPRFNHYYRK